MDDAVRWACLAHAESKPLDVTQIRKRLASKERPCVKRIPFCPQTLYLQCLRVLPVCTAVPTWQPLELLIVVFLHGSFGVTCICKDQGLK